MNYILLFNMLAVWGLVQDPQTTVSTKSDAPYLLEHEWESLLHADPPISREARGQRLIKCLKGKLPITVPEWWGTLVQSVEVGPEKLHPVENEESLKEAMNRWQESGDVKFSGFKSVDVSADGRTVILGGGEKTLKLSPQTAWREDRDDWPTSDYGGIAGLIVDDICLVVPMCPTGSPGGPYVLYSYDVKSRKLRWKRDLVTGVIYTYSHPQFGGYTEVAVRDGKVIVWSGSEIAAMVQMFDVLNGNPILRFATNSDRLVEDKKRNINGENGSGLNSGSQ